MWYRPIHAVEAAGRRASLAGLAAGLSVVGCVAVFLSDSRAYADLSNARLESLVGTKGSCCVPGLKTSCSSTGLFACASSGVVCDAGGYSVDTCGDPSCTNSDTSTDQCDSSEYGSYTISATTCSVTSAAPIPCDDGGMQCAFTATTSAATYTGCGTSTICSVTSGVACQ
jgi:hypothetical protein